VFCRLLSSGARRPFRAFLDPEHTTLRWWNGGFEMRCLGVAVAAAAYGSGALAARLLNP
jgi:hypothetical protein